MSMNWNARALTLLAAVALIPVTFAQGNSNTCSNSNTAGTYSVVCDGWTVPTAGAPLVPIKQVGIATGDASGNWSGATTINIAGQTVIPDAKVTGQGTVNSDCTGSITYNKGTPNPINITFVVNLKTEEIFGLVTDKGSVISCVLKRMTNGRGAPGK
jgi:hypothetical protein